MPRFDRKQQSCQMESRIRFVAIGFRPAEFRRLEQRAICFQLPIDLWRSRTRLKRIEKRQETNLVRIAGSLVARKDKVSAKPV